MNDPLIPAYLPTFELEYWETEEFMALQRLQREASALWKVYAAEVVPHVSSPALGGN